MLVVSSVEWYRGGCYFKVVADGRIVQLCLWEYGRQEVVIVRWLM